MRIVLYMRIALSLTVLSVFLLVQSSCTPVCDNIPTVQPAQIRALNAVPDVPILLIYIDGQFFDSAYYDLSKYDNPQVSQRHSFGYRTTALGTGSGVSAGAHRITAINASVARDTLKDTTVLLTDLRQTLLYMGRHQVSNATFQHPLKMIYLNDDAREVDNNKSLARFVHGVADLKGIDVYFSQHVKRDATGKPKPDVSFTYGQVSDKNGGGNGTGNSPDDYYEVPSQNNDGLLITGQGDTSNVILLVTTAFNHNGFLNTVIVRGETKPIGLDPIISSLVLEDGKDSPGVFNFESTTFGVRVVNATRGIPVSLLPQGPQDQLPRTDIPRQQISVFHIKADSISPYLALTPYYHGNALQHFTSDTNGSRLFDFFTTIRFIATVDRRYSFVVFDSAKLNNGLSRYGVFVVTDTLSQPGDRNLGRVRFVNTSPDHTMNFDFGGSHFALQQKGVGVADAAVTPQSITVSDGAVSRTLSVTPVSGAPITVYFLPATLSDPFPYAVAQNE